MLIAAAEGVLLVKAEELNEQSKQKFGSMYFATLLI